MQIYVVDGSFITQYINMKQPYINVTLSDGLEYRDILSGISIIIITM
jgi:hypothetical protein